MCPDYVKMVYELYEGMEAYKNGVFSDWYNETHETEITTTFTFNAWVQSRIEWEKRKIDNTFDLMGADSIRYGKEVV